MNQYNGQLLINYLNNQLSQQTTIILNENPVPLNNYSNQKMEISTFFAAKYLKFTFFVRLYIYKVHPTLSLSHLKADGQARG
jgi:hypothetical protein